jgi:hypothetical protein
VVRLALVALALSGCMSATGLVKALGNDPATVCASYVGIYGNVQVSRTALLNGVVTCSKDGMTVKSEEPVK